MARPTKKEAEKKKVLREIVKRDKKFYTIFEDHGENISKESLINNFCLECEIRDTPFFPYHFAMHDTLPEDFQKKLESYGLEELVSNHKNIPIEKRKYCYEVFAFPLMPYLHDTNDSDKFIIENRFNYFFSKSLLEEILKFENKNNQQYLKYHKKLHNDKYEDFSFKDEIEEKTDILKIIDFLIYFDFKWEYIEEYINNPDSHHKDVEIFNKKEINEIYNLLKKYIKKIMKFSSPFYHTYIKKNNVLETNINKSYFIEVDLTKPKKNILEYISTIKDDFDKNPSKFNKIHDKLELTPTPYICNKDECEIFKLGTKGTNKPLYGIMADILFIYDCYKLDLGREYAIDEINRYWNEIKNINTDKFSKSTYKRYKNIAIDYIENKKYLSYLTGYKIPPAQSNNNITPSIN